MKELYYLILVLVCKPLTYFGRGKKLRSYIDEHYSDKSKVVLVNPCSVEQVLREDQKKNAIKYYKDNKDRVDFMIRQTDKAYEPSQSEDKNDPMIWKAEHWNWFLTAMEED